MITSSGSRTSRRLTASAAFACLFALGLGSARGAAEDEPRASEAVLLEARFERLEARADASYAEGAIEQARQALRKGAEAEERSQK